MIPHFTFQNINGFNADEEPLRVCITFSSLVKMSKPVAVPIRREAGFFPWKNPV